MVVIILADVGLASSLDKGSVEIMTRVAFTQNSLSLDGNDIGNETHAELLGGAGYFFSKRIELVGNFAYQRDEINPAVGEEFRSSLFAFSGGVYLNFPSESNVVPFLGAEVGVGTFSGDAFGDKTATIFPILTGGLRFLIGDSASINLSGVYSHVANAAGFEDVSNNAFGLGVGISVFP
jgi:hypothetical protein